MSQCNACYTQLKFSWCWILFFPTQKYKMSQQLEVFCLATCPRWPWYFLFVIQMRWDSGHWLWSHHWLVTRGEGGWAVDVVSEMGLSRLIYFNVINWEDHILVGAGVGPGHRGRGTPGKWSANVTTGWVITGMAGSLVWWVLSPCPQFLPRCLPQFQDATFTCHQPFLSRWHNVGVIPAHQEARKPIDHWQISELTDLTGSRPSQWRVGGCDAEIVSIFGMSIVN